MCAVMTMVAAAGAAEIDPAACVISFVSSLTLRVVTVAGLKFGGVGSARVMPSDWSFLKVASLAVPAGKAGGLV